MIRKFRQTLHEYCPTAALAVFTAALMALILSLISRLSVPFSDFCNATLGMGIRFVLAKLTGWIPFSLAETILCCLPVFFILVIVRAVKLSRINDRRQIVRFLCALLAVSSLFYTLFICGFAMGYRGSTLESKLGMTRRNVSADELQHTAEILVKKMNDLSDEITFTYGSFSVMPYTLDEMNSKLCDAYAQLAEQVSAVSSVRTHTKYVVGSEIMSYMHITGVYTYYTGEANININFPDYTIPYTAAHEMAHQRGFAREDEANFVAFLVCDASGDPYIRYSGYLNLYQYVVGALYTADSSRYYQVLGGLDIRVRYELIAYNEFFEPYRETVVSSVSSAVNDTYLHSQGQKEGSKSYGRVVDLAVAYYVTESN